MKKMYLMKKYLEDKDLSDCAFTIIAALQPYSSNRNDMLLTAEYISYLVFGRSATRKELETIKLGLDELIQAEIVKVDCELTKSQLVCNVSGLYFEQGKEFFVILNCEELHKIMNIEAKVDRYKMFRYFASIIGHFNFSETVDRKYKGKVCGYAIECINELIPKRTAIRYNEILEENNLIYIHRADDILYNTTSKEIKRIINTYGRYEDKELVEEFAAIYQNSYGWNHISKRKKSEQETANKNRALGQKYKNYCNGKQYDEETVNELLEWAIKKKKDLNMFILNGVIKEEESLTYKECDNTINTYDYCFMDDDDDDCYKGYILRASDHLVINEDGEYELPI